MKRLLAGVVGLSLTTRAFAVNYSGPGIPIADLVGGTTQINVPESFALTDVNVTLTDFTHQWIGDLAVTLEHSGQSAILFYRVGYDGTTATRLGFSSDPNGNYTFDSQSTNNFWTACAAPPIVPGTYDTHGGFAAGNNTDALNVFNGTDSAGIWTLTFTEHHAGDNGNLGGWTLHLAPEPAGLLLLAAATMSFMRRRDCR